MADEMKVTEEELKKLNGMAESLYSTMTPEQKAKAQVCKNVEELSAFMGEEGIELPDEILDEVGGGMSLAVPQFFARLLTLLFGSSSGIKVRTEVAETTGPVSMRATPPESTPIAGNTGFRAGTSDAATGNTGFRYGSSDAVISSLGGIGGSGQNGGMNTL